MVGIAEAAPKLKMDLQIDELNEPSEQDDQDSMIFRLGSDNFAPPESDIPILDSQLVS